MSAHVAALANARLNEDRAFARVRHEAETNTVRPNVNLLAGSLTTYGRAVYQTVRHTSNITQCVLSALRMGCSDTAMGNRFVNFVPKAGDARPTYMMPATGTAAPAPTYTFGGDTYNFATMNALTDGPRNIEANAIMAIVCHAVLKEPTTRNQGGFLTNRVNALNGRSNNALRASAVSGPNALTLDILQRIHVAFASDPSARRALCHIVFNCIMYATTPMEEAIASQNQLLMGSGVSSALRAANFIMAFPEVVDIVPQLRRESAEVVRMLSARAAEDPLTIAFAGQMYRDMYRTVKVGPIATLVTVAILLERQASTSAEFIVTPIRTGPQFTACEELAKAIAVRAEAQMKAYAEAAAKLTTS